MSQNLMDPAVSPLRHFETIDYVVFGFMLTICSFIGLYFAYKDHQEQNASKNTSGTLNYLLGGRKVQVLPVAISLVATYVSGITLLGTSTEIYFYGIEYAYILVGPAMMAVFMHYIVIPVFYDLKVVSMFEYLQKRFDVRIRLFASFVYSFATVIWFPIVIYVPALAVNQTTGIDVHVTTPIILAICVFYTCIGGIKAVIWTDVLQTVVMVGVMLLIMIKGTLSVGGLGVLFERNWESGRIELPDFDPDPTLRHTFWTLVVGGSGYWIIVNTNQNVVQRFLALKNEKASQRASLYYAIGITILTLMCIYNGLLLYATFHDCDPLTTKLASAKDQMIPLLVTHVLRDIPGLSGLFIAGIFSAALSSLSSGLNSMSAIVLEDYCKPCFKNGLSEFACGIILRATVFILGIVAVLLVYVIEQLGPVLQLSMSIPATCFGSVFGVFVIGMFLPWVGKRATFYAALIASILTTYIVMRSQFDMLQGRIHYETKPISTDGCTYNFTQTVSASKNFTEKFEPQLHNISYLYYMPLGSIVTLTLSIIFSFWFGFENPGDIDKQLLAPCVRKFVALRCKKVTKEKRAISI